MGMSLDWWSGKRVFLTGHTGFKGGWCSLWLRALGAELTGYALGPDSPRSFFELAQVAQGMNSIIGDILDLERLTDAMRGSEPQIVLHLAAQSIVRAGYERPVETYATNVVGTANVLDAARRAA